MHIFCKHILCIYACIYYKFVHMFDTCVYEAAELAATQNRGSRHRPQPSQTPRGFWVHWREKRSRRKVIKRDRARKNIILLQTDGDLCCYFMMFSCSSSAVDSNHVLWCMMGENYHQLQTSNGYSSPSETSIIGK